MNVFFYHIATTVKNNYNNRNLDVIDIEFTNYQEDKKMDGVLVSINRVIYMKMVQFGLAYLFPMRMKGKMN